MSDFIASPEGTIQFVAVKNKVRNKPTDTEATVYTARLEFDGSTKEGAAFKEAIAAVNPGLIGTKHASTPDHFTVKASTRYDVKVFDQNNTLLEGDDIPAVGKGATGTAVMVVKPYTGNPLGGSLNLISLAFKSLELGEEQASLQEGLIDKLRGMIS